MPKTTQGSLHVFLLVRSINQARGSLAAARNWKMRVNLGQRLIFPPETTTITLWPDLVLWSNSCQYACITELTVPSEFAAFEHIKKLWYNNLAAEAEDTGWKVKVHAVEVGCRDSAASSKAELLRGSKHQNPGLKKGQLKSCQRLLRVIYWLWIKRWDPTWAPKQQKQSI